MSWPDEVMENYTREQQRFRLIEIAFEKALANQGQKEHDIPAIPVAKAVVEYADAVLAAMDKEQVTEPDAAPPAAESGRRTRTDDGELLVR